MKKLILIVGLLLLPAFLFGKTGQAVSSAHDVQGDTTLIVTLDLDNRVPNGKDELIVLVDSLSDNSTLTSTSGLTIIARPRIDIRYAITTGLSTKTTYNSVKDSSLIVSSWTDSLAIGMQTFTADSLRTVDKVQYELDFSAGDTMRVILIHRYEKDSWF